MSEFMYTSADESYVVYQEGAAKLYETVNQHFRDYVVEKGAKEYVLPSMIERDVLDKCGYFASFPQHLTAAAYIKESQFDKVTKEASSVLEHMEISDTFFTPAACLHIYPCLTGKDIKEEIITTLAHVYRYETKEYDGKTRLWNFHVREIVFAGSEDYVTAKLEEIAQEAKRFAQSLGLCVELKYASDHFYPSKRNLIKARMQKSNSLKRELTAQINGKEVALGSFNFHGNHFSEPFGFSKQNTVVTGCAGFGLERWVTALMEQEENR